MGKNARIKAYTAYSFLVRLDHFLDKGHVLAIENVHHYLMLKKPLHVTSHICITVRNIGDFCSPSNQKND